MCHCGILLGPMVFTSQPTSQRRNLVANDFVKQWSIRSGSGRPVRSNVPSIFTVTIVGLSDGGDVSAVNDP